MNGVPFPIAGSGQGQSIDINGDLTTVLGDNNCSHAASHLGKEVGYFHSEEAFIRVSRLTAEHIHDFFNRWMVSGPRYVDHGKPLIWEIFTTLLTHFIRSTVAAAFHFAREFFDDAYTLDGQVLIGF